MDIYHRNHPDKHKENSPFGIHEAIRLHKDAIDLDGLLSKRGTWYAQHDERVFRIASEGWYDPQGLIHHTARMDELWNKEIDRLRTHDGFRMWRMIELMRETARNSPTLIDLIEPKFDNRLGTDKPWVQLRTMAQNVFGHDWAHRVQVYALWDAPIRAARRAGFKAWKIS